MHKNITEITSRCRGNLERQILVISYLDSLESEPQPKKVKRACSTEVFDVEEVAEPSSVSGVVLDDFTERTAAKYASWKKELLLELMNYLEPRMWPLAKHATDSVQMLRQILKFCTDLCCTEVNQSRRSDRPQGKLKKTIFGLKLKDGSI
eukprot:2173330-Amphidinium_carterae.1